MTATEAGSPRAAPELCYVDVGGTFTDAFVVAEDGSFALAKAFSTPGDVSEGFLAALTAVAQEAGSSRDQLCASLRVLGYGSTIVLNTLLTRQGVRTGLVVTAGFEDLLLMERGKQTWTDYERVDRIHPVTHRHLDPLVPKRLIAGVTERIDCFGDIVIPLYEEEARAGIGRLLDCGVEAIAVCFLWSFLNNEHEQRAGAIARELAAQRGLDVAVYLSSDVSPVARELSRANATIIEAYTTPRAAAGLGTLEARLRQDGFGGAVQIMQSSGGLAPLGKVRAVETIQSGPVGGVIGGRFIASLYGIDHILTSDVGGTSFDVALVTAGQVQVNREPVAVGMILGVPMVEILSIGAGGGTIAKLDEVSGRLSVGPQSAGAVPGPACLGQGGTLPTVTDADLVLGYLDPGSFAAGRGLDVQASRQAIAEHVADPLGLTIEEAADGIKHIIDVRMQDTLSGLVAARGFDIRDYHLLAFGGAGPSHVSGYSAGLSLAGVLAFAFSSVFSAFGAAAADYEHHYTRACNIIVPPFADDGTKVELGRRLNVLWLGLAERAVAQMESEGFERSRLTLQPQAMMRYGRQLNDLVVPSPVQQVASSTDWDRLVEAFERQYEQIYAKAAKYPQSGFEIFEVGLVATATKLKPRLPRHELHGPDPPSAAYRGSRPAWFDGERYETRRFEMQILRAGNRIEGPAVVHDRTTCLVVPPGSQVVVDQFKSFWLERA
jgi:acetone carboxylase beta subunit